MTFLPTKRAESGNREVSVGTDVHPHNSARSPLNEEDEPWEVVGPRLQQYVSERNKMKHVPITGIVLGILIAIALIAFILWFAK